MHATQALVVNEMLDAHRKPHEKLVYDIGSYDVNGSHKADVLARGLQYVGVDMAAGPNVDIVVEPYDWGLEAVADILISGSCLEHVEAPWMWVREAEKACRPGGLLIVTTPYSLGQHRYPKDCYRYLPDGMKYLFSEWGTFEHLASGFRKGPRGIIDSYFAGRKK